MTEAILLLSSHRHPCGPGALFGSPSGHVLICAIALPHCSFFLFNEWQKSPLVSLSLCPEAIPVDTKCLWKCPWPLPEPCPLPTVVPCSVVTHSSLGAGPDLPSQILGDPRVRPMGHPFCPCPEPRARKYKCGLPQPCPEEHLAFRMVSGAANVIGPKICLEDKM